jgi:hypothetical protein
MKERGSTQRLVPPPYDDSDSPEWIGAESAPPQRKAMVTPWKPGVPPVVPLPTYAIKLFGDRSRR